MTSRTQLRRRLFAAALPGAVAAALVTIPATPAQAISDTIVINEVYGGGGNAGATYTNDFIELKNVGTTDVDISTWSVQYASATSTTTAYAVTNLTGHIAAGETYLVQEASNASVGSPLPSPDATGTIAMAGGAGKVALVRSQTALTCTVPACDTAPGVIDYVGYGPTANDSETAPTSPALTSSTSASRNAAGGDTDNNSTDFAAGPASPDSCGAACVTEEPPPPIGNCGDPATFIHQIQGSGAAYDPAFGGDQVIEGVVTAAMLGGVFVEEEVADRDSDPTTSEGIFVFLSGQTAPAEGAQVRVAGTVAEFGGKTQLTDATVKTCDTVPAAIEPTAVTFPVDDPADLERFEDMLVKLPQEMVISEYFNYARFGEVVVGLPLADQARLFTPTAVVEPGDPARELAAKYARRIITIDDVNTSQNPAVIPHPGNGRPFSLENSFRGGDTITGIDGILDDSFDRYRIQPTEYGDSQKQNPRPEGAPDVGKGEVQVASFNVLNYFLTLDQGSNKCGPSLDQGCRGADDEEERQRQRDKILAALAELDADVVGLMEMENSPGVEPAADLVRGLNERLGAGTYEYVDTGVVGTDAIRVGMLYKPGTVTPIGDFDILSSADDPRFDDTKSRPMLTQTFDESASGERFTVSVNHLKSKGSPCAGDPDTGDGQANCNQTRTRAAQAIVDHLATDPTNSGDRDHLIIGDLNSYDHEDPIDALVAGGFTDMVKQFGGEYAYSYVFDGQAGYLDHALASSSLVNSVTGAKEWHINADEPSILDYDTSFKPPAVDALYAPDEFRASDHDAVLVGLHLSREAATPTITADPSTIMFRKTSTISGVLTDREGAPIEGAEVRLERRPTTEQGWIDTGQTDTTDDAGAYEFIVKPLRNNDYWVVFAGDDMYEEVTSPQVRVNVAPLVRVAISDQTVTRGTQVMYSGIVVPNHGGDVVRIQKQNDNGTWRLIGERTLNRDSFDQYKFMPSLRGTSHWRIFKPADADHVRGISRTFTMWVS